MRPVGMQQPQVKRQLYAGRYEAEEPAATTSFSMSDVLGEILVKVQGRENHLVGTSLRTSND
jgi:hypothetical protein